MKWVVVVAVAAALTFVVFMAWAIGGRNAAEDSCATHGGIAVKSHYGPLICVRRDALVPESEWKP